jgi:hypothetical protein
MLRIGLTGGIASGKTTVANLFAARGATVLDTDVIAREVVEPGRPALGSLVRALGAGILAADGRLDRAELRRRLFEDAAAVILERHPWAEAEFQSRGWLLPRSIDRVYVVDKAMAGLGYRPVQDFAALFRRPPA